MKLSEEPTTNLPRLHAQFILTAVLSLFCYMITYPTASTFPRDIQILQDTVELFAELHRKSHDTRCFPPMYFTQAFIQRLVLLAQEALLKARRSDQRLPGPISTG